MSKGRENLNAKFFLTLCGYNFLCADQGEDLILLIVNMSTLLAKTIP